MSVILAAWAAAIGWFDFRTRRIPNVALIVLLVPALLALAFDGRGLLGQAPVSSLLGLVAVGLLMWPGYRLGQTGAGDVKFAACLGLLLGLWQGLDFLLLALIAMGLASLAALAVQASRSGRLDRTRRLPAGAVLAAAFCVELAAGPLLPSFRTEPAFLTGSPENPMSRLSLLKNLNFISKTPGREDSPAESALAGPERAGLGLHSPNSYGYWVRSSPASIALRPAPSLDSPVRNAG